MRPWVQMVVLSMALVAGPLASDAAAKASFPAPPPPGRFTSDGAGLIEKEDGQEIDRLAAALLAEKGYPVSVVTIRSLASQDATGYTIERYAAELMQSWRAEERFRTYGMLLLVAAEDRKARIQLGSAWGEAHDDRARRIMDRLILPAFRDEEMSLGILEGVRGFDAMGRQLTLAGVDDPWWMPPALAGLLPVIDVGGLGGFSGLDRQWWRLPALVAGGLVLLVALVSVARGGRRSWAWAAAAFVLTIFASRAVSAARGGGGSGGGATGEW
jgi:uncharacterized protein